MPDLPKRILELNSHWLKRIPSPHKWWTFWSTGQNSQELFRLSMLHGKWNNAAIIRWCLKIQLCSAICLMVSFHLVSLSASTGCRRMDTPIAYDQQTLIPSVLILKASYYLKSPPTQWLLILASSVKQTAFSMKSKLLFETIKFLPSADNDNNGS